MMGNLRDSKTDEEWDDMLTEIAKEKAMGKPDTSILHLSIFGKTKEELIQLRKTLSNFFDDYQLRDLDKWINYLSKL